MNRPSSLFVKRLGIALLLILIAVGTAWIYGSRESPKSESENNFVTTRLSVGDIRRTVSASGTLKPVVQVDIGTQVSGSIRTLNVDFNDVVKEGQVLAEIDTSLLDEDLAQAQAQHRSALVNYELARSRLVRSESLFNQGFVARSDVDEARAALLSTRASVDQYYAVVRRASSNRRFATIRSPVSGTVVAREVAVGQTVAASLQTPILFRIAKDLKEMQIETSVSEADVGHIQLKQQVNFTVDAFPDKVFTGEVHEIRNNYAIQQNVVTYTVIVRTRNDDLTLRPGMTGYVTVIVGQRNRVTRVPNAVLRYEPEKRSNVDGVKQANHRTIWRLSATGQPEAIEVVLGLSDSRYSELLSGTVRDSDALIIGEKIVGGFAGPKLF